MDKAAIVSGFLYYLEVEGKPISRAEAEQRLFKKLAQGRVLDDMRPLVPVRERAGVNDDAARAAIAQILAELVTRIPGDSWERTPELRERFGIPTAD